MYLGLVVEQAPSDTIFHDPQHPYTRRCCARSPSWASASRASSTRSRAWCPTRTTGRPAAPSTRAAPASSQGTCDVIEPPHRHVLGGRAGVAAWLYGGERVATEATTMMPGTQTSTTASTTRSSQVKDLQDALPDHQRASCERTVGHVKAVDDVSFCVCARRDAGPGRRERLRQDDHRPLHHARLRRRPPAQILYHGKDGTSVDLARLPGNQLQAISAARCA